MKTPINNNLEELFKKAKADEQNLDDFEKEALAGFAMLESETEAQELKASLDKIVTEKLFKKEQKNNPKIYWLAAAGLFLIIGLTSLFVLNNSDSLSKNKNFAVLEPVKESVEDKIFSKNSPESKSELPIEDISTNKTPLIEKTESKEKEQENLLRGDSPVSNDGLTGSPESRQRENITSTIEQNEVVGDAERKDTKIGTGIGSKKDNAPIALSTTSTKGTSDLEDDDEKYKPKVSKSNDMFKLSENPSKEEANSDYGFKQEAKPVESEKLQQDSHKDANSSIAGIHRRESDEKNLLEDKSKKSKNKKKESAANIVSTETIDNKPGAPSEISKTTPLDDQSINTISTSKNGVNNANCYYIGGEINIIKDIQEKLILKNLNKKFDALLYINQNKIVDSVKFTNSYDFTDKQLESVLEVLKTLNKFNFKVTPTKKEKHSYTLIYRP